MGRIINDLRYRLSLQSTVNILIAINCGLYILLHLIAFVLAGKGISYDYLLSFASLPSGVNTIIMHPWTIITYMFAQTNLFHLLFNMIWLYWFGIFLSDRFSGKRILSLYICGGLSGALFFIIASMLTGSVNPLVGSSASVFAIMTTTVFLMPNRSIDLLFIPSVKLKWVGLVMIALSFIGGSMASNIAHLGGIAAGAAFAASYILPIRKSRPIVPRTTTPAKSMDDLLDKIRRSGYASLNKSERERLNFISKEMQQKSHQR